MAVGIEGDVNAGVSHLVSNICCRFPIRDQRTREEVAELVESRSDHSGGFHNRSSDVCLEIIWVDEPVTVAGKDERGLSITDLKICQKLHHVLGRCDTSQRFLSFRRTEVPLPLVNSVLRPPFRECVLNGMISNSKTSTERSRSFPASQRVAKKHHRAVDLA